MQGCVFSAFQLISDGTEIVWKIRSLTSVKKEYLQQVSRVILCRISSSCSTQKKSDDIIWSKHKKSRAWKIQETAKSCFEDTTCASNCRRSKNWKHHKENSSCLFVLGLKFHEIDCWWSFVCFAFSKVYRVKIVNRSINFNQTKYLEPQIYAMIYRLLIKIFMLFPLKKKSDNVRPIIHHQCHSTKVRNHNLNAFLLQSSFMPFLIKIKLFRLI